MLHLNSYPLLHHTLVELRGFVTSPSRVRRPVRQPAPRVYVETTARLATRLVRGTGPLAPHQDRHLARPVVLVPILRAGLGMIEGPLGLLPDAKAGHPGMARNEHTLLPNVHYSKLPAEITGADSFVLAPMQAAGGTASAAPGAAPASRCPGASGCVVALDEGLDDRGYILPDPADAGDRLHDTTPA